MFFKAKELCTVCQGEVLVYPASTKMSRINERTLPGWKRCLCSFDEITRAEFSALVPGWEKLLNPKADEDDEATDEEFHKVLMGLDPEVLKTISEMEVEA